MKNKDRIFRTLCITAVVLVIVVVILMLAGASCRAGYCTKYPERCGWDSGGKEGYQMDVDHIGAFNLIGSVDDGPRFQLYKGAGKYAFLPGSTGYTGIYGDPRRIGESVPERNPNMTPETWMYCGYLSAPKGGCGNDHGMCSNKCGYQKRGCPERYDEYTFWPHRTALPP